MKLLTILASMAVVLGCHDIDHQPEEFPSVKSTKTPISNTTDNQSEADSVEINIENSPEDKETLSDITTAYKSCSIVQEKLPLAKNGIYKLYYSDSTGLLTFFNAYCDLESEGGGWTLILNYVHKGSTSPQLTFLLSELPLLGPGILGDDEQNTKYFGHATPTLLSKISATELRFFCQSSATNRIIHFQTDDANCLNYAKTGVGNCFGINENFNPLAGHTGLLPEIQASNANTNNGDRALTSTPMRGVGGTNHWAINNGNGEWECDDDSDTENTDTIHRIWVR